MIPYEPTKIDRPFAYNGARNDIPVDGGTETGNASLDLGFPPITSQPLSQGGIPPQRKDFNGILYLLSAYAYYAQSGGLYAWDEALDYAVNCVVTYGNNIYICIANNGASTAAGVVEPGTDESYWLELFVYLLRASGGDVGSPVNPMYIANGQFVASTANVGSGTQPMYMNAGTLTASTSTVGADDTPVFLKAGILTACTGVGTDVFRRASLGTTGYVVFNNGLVINWGRATKSSGTHYYTYTKPISYTTYTAYIGQANNTTTSTSGLAWMYASSTTTTERFYDSTSSSDSIAFLIIGYTSS